MIVNWVQPVITSNGTLGDNYFAVAGAGYSGQSAYQAFDGSASTLADMTTDGTGERYLEFYNPNPLNVTSIVLNQYVTGSTYCSIKNGAVYTSNDGTNWTSLTTFAGTQTADYTIDLTSNTGYYNYYKIEMTDSYYLYQSNYYWYVKECSMIATANVTNTDIKNVQVNVATAENAIGDPVYATYGPLENAFKGSATVGVFAEIYNGSSLAGVGYIGQQNLTKKVERIKFWQGGYGSNSYNLGVTSLKIQISEDGTNWTDVQTVALNNGTASSTTCYLTEIEVEDYQIPSTPYQMRLLANSGVVYGNGGGWLINLVEFYVTETIELPKYKDLETIERRYYKYTDIAFEQPVLSADGIIDGDSFACFASSYYSSNYYIYYAFNGVTTGSYWCSSNGTGIGAYIGFYNPKHLKVTNLRLYNQTTGSGDGIMTSGTIQASNDNSNYIDVGSFSGNTWGSSYIDVAVDTLGEYYKYYRVVCSGYSSNNYATMCEVVITATIRDTEESTVSDYDFYVDEHICSSLANTETKYYKYVDETWVRPTLTSNTSYGTITASNGSASAYALFNGSQVNIAWNGGTVSFVWELPHEVTFNQAQYQPVSTTSPVVYPVTAFYIDMLQDGSWVNVYSKSSPSASLYTVNITPIPTNSVRVRMTPYSGWYNPSGVRNVAFFGVAKTGVEESTSSDYDFYKNLTTYKTLEV